MRFIICNTEEDIKNYELEWGNQNYEITIDDIKSLLEGKTLASNCGGEYEIFIKLSKED